jgi:hypothetical protein
MNKQHIFSQRIRNRMRAVSTLACLASLVMVANPVHSRSTATLNGQSIEIANQATVLEESDEKMFADEKRVLMSSIRLSPVPLPYLTTRSIPDARKLGYGDCKSVSVAFRNILISKGFIRDSLLLALAYTERGESHAVLIVRAIHGRKRIDFVFDIRVGKIETIDQSISSGYRYYSIEATPEGPLVGWNGKRYN